MATLLIGTTSGPQTPALPTSLLFTVRGKTSLELGGLRSDASDSIDLDDLAGRSDVIVEVELEDGLCVWLRPEEVRDSRYFVATTERGGATVLIPAGRGDRGLGRVVAKAARILEVSLGPSLVAGAARDVIVQRIDGEAGDSLHGLQWTGTGLPKLESNGGTRARVPHPAVSLRRGGRPTPAVGRPRLAGPGCVRSPRACRHRSYATPASRRGRHRRGRGRRRSGR